MAEWSLMCSSRLLHDRRLCSAQLMHAMLPAAAAQWQTTCANIRSHMCTSAVQVHYARWPPRAFRECAWSSRHSRGQEPRRAISQQLTAHAQRPAEVVVLGAGAAGLTAAYFAALSGAKVLLKASDAWQQDASCGYWKPESSPYPAPRLTPT
jgi:FAD binding domain